MAGFTHHPSLHASVRAGWMNDPNGLSFHDGVWHAFCQHNPAADVHADMHWAHFTSTDLARWTEQPVALAPDPLGQIFSGSVVVDHDDTAGFGAGAMVAIFTHHLAGADTDYIDGRESQSLAWSVDGGMTWTKYAGNPVLESTVRDFRDPKVIRFGTGDDQRWVMCLAVGHQINFYASDNLRDWDFTGSYATELWCDGVWECPDLIALPRADGSTCWALVFSVHNGGAHGHSGTVAVIGDFDGETMHATGAPVVLDHGPDFYAAQSFWGAEAAVGAPVVTAWLGSWRYARVQPSQGRRGMLTLPRTMSVETVGGTDQIRLRPAADLANGHPLSDSSWDAVAGRALKVDVTGEAGLRIEGAGGLVAEATFDASGVTLTRHRPTLEHYNQTYDLPTTGTNYLVVIDHGAIEVFPEDGSPGLTASLFPGTSWSVHADGAAQLVELSP